jgi:hypothetical protein
MSEETTEWRLTQLESSQAMLTENTMAIKTMLTALTVKLDSYSPTAVVLLQQTMIDNNSRLIGVEEKVDGITKKILIWSGIASVILFLLGQLLIPYALTHLAIKPAVDNNPPIYPQYYHGK